MKTPPPDKPFDPDDPNFDPWADDPNAPKEPGLDDDETESDPDLPWLDEPFDAEDAPTPTPAPAANVRGPAALLDSELRGEIEFEILFQQTKAEFLRPPPVPPPAVRLAVLLPFAALFLAWGATQQGVLGMAAVAGVFALHHLGHHVGQRLGRYREPELRFCLGLDRRLPANTTAPAGARAVTFLLGPLPGLALALLIVALGPPADGPLDFFAMALVGFNLAELWPHTTSDGGKLFALVPALRPPWVGTVVRAAIVGLLVAALVWVPSTPARILLGLLIAVLVLDCLRAHRLARSRAALANIFPALPPRPADIPDDALRRLFHVTLALDPARYDPDYLAGVMRNLHAQAQLPAMPRPVAVAAVAAYLLGWLLAAGTVGLWVAAAEERAAAVGGLLTAFEPVMRATPDEWPAATRAFLATWAAADPQARRDAWQEMDRWAAKSPPKSAAMAEFVEKLRP